MITTPKRYQLNKEATNHVRSGHPWIFRKHTSSAISVFPDGQWLMLVDAGNRVVGYGVYEQSGAVAVRVFGTDRLPTAAHLVDVLRDRMAVRASLSATTNAIRWLAGDADGIPGCVIEQIGNVVIGQSYSRGADAMTRFLAWHCAKELGVRTVMIRAGRRRHGAAPQGSTAATVAKIVEAGLEYSVEVGGGQKTGGYLDLRNLRAAIRALPLGNGRTLNLFSYTGMLGVAAHAAGTKAVVHVDSSQAALDFANRHHCSNDETIVADVFKWLGPFAKEHPQAFELVIVDPPAMTSSQSDVPQVLATYRRLAAAAASMVQPNGFLVFACCTSRIERELFRSTVARVLPDFAVSAHLPMPIDHPAPFQQAEYLKVSIYQRKA